MIESDSCRYAISLRDLAQSLDLDPQKLKIQLSKISGSAWGSPTVHPELVRELLLKRKYQYPRAQVVSIQMLKGGVGKTTTVLNLGLRAAMYGARVLFIDLDQQANLSFSLGIADETLPVWLDVVEKRKNIEECVLHVDWGLDLIPSSLNNSVLDRNLLNSNRNWAQAIKAPLEKIRHRYDYIFIDTAPALSAVNTAVTVASDLVILPVTPDAFSYSGLTKHLEELSDIRKDFGLSFKEKVLFTRFDGRENASKEFLTKTNLEQGKSVFQNFISTSSDVKGTISGDRHLYLGKSVAKDDYDRLTREFMEI